jgi:UDP-4-amino-4,6-dideoxy-N-acetyl-beta-L-altrosamine N-acetyltransferase
LKLHTLKLEVLENNERAINFFKKLGFKEEGRLREFVFKEDIWYDAIIMGITEKEYKENEENYKNS